MAHTRTTGVAQAEASGKTMRQTLIIPKVPILSRMPTSIVEAPGVACSAVSGSQVCRPAIGAFTANAKKKATNNQRPIPTSRSSFARSASRKLGCPAPVVRAHTPATPNSITRPPASENSRNFTAALVRLSPPHPEIMKYIGISVASNMM